MLSMTKINLIKIEIWYNKLKEFSYDNFIFLIGNKSDLEEEREVTIENVETFRNKYDDIKLFLETSALDGKNMDKLLDKIAISIYEKETNEENEINKVMKEERIKLNKDEDFTKNKRGKKKKKDCC